MLWNVVGQHLELPDVSVTPLVAQRLGSQYYCEEFSDALLECDEALEVIDRTDINTVQTTKKSHGEHLEWRNSFRQEFIHKARSVRDAAGPSPPPATTSVLPHHCSQALARTFCPPGASVWKNNKVRGWNGHLPPAPRKSEPLHRHASSDEALRSLMQRLWRDYLDRNGLPDIACTVTGLFE